MDAVHRFKLHSHLPLLSSTQPFTKVRGQLLSNSLRKVILHMAKQRCVGCQLQIQSIFELCEHFFKVSVGGLGIGNRHKTKFRNVNKKNVKSGKGEQ